MANITIPALLQLFLQSPFKTCLALTFQTMKTSAPMGVKANKCIQFVLLQLPG